MPVAVVRRNGVSSRRRPVAQRIRAHTDVDTVAMTIDATTRLPRLADALTPMSQSTHALLRRTDATKPDERNTAQPTSQLAALYGCSPLSGCGDDRIVWRPFDAGKV
ncbi:hypothetical protein ABT320_12040 [Streptomyces cellulosae]